MKLTQLRYLCEIARTGSQTAAAEHLNLSQPALGLQVRALEAEFGVPLFHRRSRGMELTEAGRALYGHAERVLALLDEAEAEMRRFALPKRRVITLGAAPTPGKLLLPPLLRAVAETEDLSLVLHEDLSSELTAQLRAGQLDLALSYDPSAGRDLRTAAIARDELILVGPPGELGCGGRRVRFEDLPRYPLIVDSHRQITRRLLDDLAGRERVQLDIFLEVDSVNLKREVVLSEGCFAIVPRGLFADAIGEGRFGWAQIVGPAVTRFLKLNGRPGLPRKDFERMLAILRPIVAMHIRSGAVNWHDVPDRG